MLVWRTSDKATNERRHRTQDGIKYAKHNKVEEIVNLCYTSLASGQQAAGSRCMQRIQPSHVCCIPLFAHVQAQKDIN